MTLLALVGALIAGSLHAAGLAQHSYRLAVARAIFTLEHTALRNTPEARKLSVLAIRQFSNVDPRLLSELHKLRSEVQREPVCFDPKDVAAVYRQLKSVSWDDLRHSDTVEMLSHSFAQRVDGSLHHAELAVDLEAVQSFPGASSAQLEDIEKARAAALGAYRAEIPFEHKQAAVIDFLAKSDARAKAMNDDQIRDHVDDWLERMNKRPANPYPPGLDDKHRVHATSEIVADFKKGKAGGDYLSNIWGNSAQLAVGLRDLAVEDAESLAGLMERAVEYSIFDQFYRRLTKGRWSPAPKK